MKKLTDKVRLDYIRRDIQKLLEELPEYVINNYPSLDSISIACDKDNEEPKYWSIVHYEVSKYDVAENAQSVSEFDTKKQAIDFMVKYSIKYPEVLLEYKEYITDLN